MLDRIRKGVFVLPPAEFLMEYYLIGAAFWWAFVLLFPLGTFSFAVAGSFGLMLRLAPLSLWGMIASFLSTWLLVALVMRWWRTRKVMLCLHTFWWFFITFMIVKTNPYSTGTGIYGIMTAMSLYMTLSDDLLPVFYRNTEKNEEDEDNQDVD